MGTPNRRKLPKRISRKSNAAKVYEREIATEVVPFSAFYRAEDYHQIF